MNDRGDHIRTLQGIEARVMEDVFVGRSWRIVGSVLTLVAATAAGAWWIEATQHSWVHAARTVSASTAASLLVAALASGAALRLRRYKWCCGAAYCGAFATVIGIGAFWWVGTGHVGIRVSWLVFADLATATLTLGWLATILTPVERSQPEMRTYFVHQRRYS